MLKASAKVNRVFETCKEDTLSPKVTELVPTRGGAVGS